MEPSAFLYFGVLRRPCRVDVAESVRCVDQVNLLSHALLSSSHIKLRE